MLTTKEVKGVRVCRPYRKGKELTKDGLPRHRRKIGKVFKTVFSPDGLKVVGFIVRRPDLLWMFKRPERFLALDAMEIQDGFIVPSRGMASWDDSAIKRLDVDYETCIIWEGMDVKTSAGKELGRVDEISFDERTGDLNSLFLDDGGTARALIGSVEIPVELMVGYKNGVLIVKPEASALLPTGGLAAKAGEATAKIGIGAKEGAKKAGAAAGKAVDKGSYGLGKMIGRAKRSVTGAVDGFRQESGAEERAAAKKAAQAAAAKSAAPAAKAGASAKTAGTAKATGTAAKSAASAKTTTSKSAAASTKSAAAKTGASAKAGASAKGGTTTAAKSAAAKTGASAKGASSAKTATKAAPAAAGKAGATAAKKAGASTKTATASKTAASSKAGGAKKAGTASSSSAAKSGTAKPKASSASKSSATSKSASASKAKAGAKSTGQAVSDHMKAAGSMFADFKKEFDEAKK